MRLTTERLKLVNRLLEREIRETGLGSHDLIVLLENFRYAVVTEIRRRNKQ